MEEFLREFLRKLVNMPNRELEIVDFDKGTNSEQAYLNWMTLYKSDYELLYGQAESYMVTAKVLSETCCQDNGDKKADTWIFPILCLFSQGYELYLKAIRSILYHLNGKNNSSVKKCNHNVDSIKNEIFNMLTVLNNETKKEVKNELEKIRMGFDKLLQCCCLKNSSDLTVFARYPIDAENSVYAALAKRENITLNIKTLKEFIEAVAASLRYTYDCIDKVLEFNSNY